ncbi:molybdate ABC transporter substrate-binding protein, partial [Selenomonas noxia]|uniref:molybdate ABC transporter substrate-binding protein n=1 Tax=Selenomonas noxia TaxID=135083 RepID=UPI003C73D140
MKIKNALTAALAAMAMLTAGCIGGGNSANKMDTPKEGLAELQVSAAASLTDAMKELGGMYEKEHGNTKLVFNFGSSGALQQAIENGGAADVFISAAQKQMNALDEKKLLADGTRADLLIKEVVLITAKD